VRTRRNSGPHNVGHFWSRRI